MPEPKRPRGRPRKPPEQSTSGGVVVPTQLDPDTLDRLDAEVERRNRDVDRLRSEVEAQGGKATGLPRASRAGVIRDLIGRHCDPPGA